MVKEVGGVRIELTAEQPRRVFLLGIKRWRFVAPDTRPLRSSTGHRETSLADIPCGNRKRFLSENIHRCIAPNHSAAIGEASGIAPENAAEVQLSIPRNETPGVATFAPFLSRFP
jgi:hypothetical protein